MAVIETERPATAAPLEEIPVLPYEPVVPPKRLGKELPRPTISDIFYRAADHMEKVGYAWGKENGRYGTVCEIGAVYAVSDFDDWEARRYARQTGRSIFVSLSAYNDLIAPLIPWRKKQRAANHLRRHAARLWLEGR